MTFDKSLTLYVANAGGSSVLGFGAGASGNVPPTVAIAGDRTTLDKPCAVALDPSRRLIVGDRDGRVIVFAGGANGNAAPLSVISGLKSVCGVESDAQNHIWAVDSGASSIDEYARGAHGDAVPMRTIEGPYTTLNHPFNILFH